MCRVASDPGSANGIIKRSLANFKRSHNDEWELHKLAFTTAQLDWLQDFFFQIIIMLETGESVKDNHADGGV